MAITIRFQGGKLAGKLLTFGDEIETIKIGRNPDRCQVVFPPDQTHVGREHCALQRVLGRYRLILNGEDRVFVNGKEAYHEEELPASADIRLGPTGPQIVVTTADQSGLPPTVARGKHQPGLGTEVTGARRTSQRGLHIAVMTVLALAAASLIGYRLHSGTAQQVLQAGEELNQTGEALNRTNEELQKTAPDLTEHLAAAARSVYLVLIKNESGEFSSGTAWVVADGTLATNSHIADDYATELGPGEKMFVRSPTNPPVDFEVTSVVMHPGYHRFNEVVVDRNPSLTGTGGQAEPLGLIPACDVALLKVADAGQLAPPLPIATDEEVQEMKVTDPIGMIGYPSEGIYGHNTATPQPSIQTGRIARLTDFLFRSDGGPQTLQLVHHSAPSVGGSSGSPMLNAEGKVIAINSAGNMIGMNGVRIPIAVGLNFGQRVDLLRELLENRADDAQKLRDAQWQSELSNFSTRADEDAYLSDAVQAWTSKTPGSRAVDIGHDRLVLKESSFGADHVAEFQVPVTAFNSYLFHIYSIGRAGVTFRLFTRPDATYAQRIDKNMATDVWEYTPKESGTVRLELETDQNTPATVDIAAYRLDTTAPLLRLFHVQ